MAVAEIRSRSRVVLAVSAVQLRLDQSPIQDPRLRRGERV